MALLSFAAVVPLPVADDPLLLLAAARLNAFLAADVVGLLCPLASSSGATRFCPVLVIPDASEARLPAGLAVLRG